MDTVTTAIVQRVRRFLRGSRVPAGRSFRQVTERFDQARWTVKLFYLASTYVSFVLMLENGRLVNSNEAWAFLWPVAWLTNLDLSWAIDWVSVACFIASLMTLQFADSRPLRLLFAVLFLFAASIPNSVGGINHTYHAWFWVAACFVLLPDVKEGQQSRAVKMSYLAILAATQALLLSFYSLAGYWKLKAGITALIVGYRGNLDPLGLAQTVADRVVQTGTSPLLADFFITQHWLAWLGFLGVIYIQLVAVMVAFRPRLHAAWGYALIGFHLGTYLLMEIGFTQHVFLLALLFVLSPFRVAEWRLREALCDLPIFGLALRYAKLGGIRATRTATVSE